MHMKRLHCSHLFPRAICYSNISSSTSPRTCILPSSSHLPHTYSSFSITATPSAAKSNTIPSPTTTTTTKSPPHSPLTQQKYCITCGRLISPNHSHFSERKYCSDTCRKQRPNALDRELEAAFVRLAREEGRGRGCVECGEVERGFIGGGTEGGEGDKRGKGVVQGKVVRSGVRNEAEWRERVRRAGRRVVVFGTGEGGERFECVQGGKVVEGSFAKGEWAVRMSTKV